MDSSRENQIECCIKIIIHLNLRLRQRWIIHLVIITKIISKLFLALVSIRQQMDFIKGH